MEKLYRLIVLIVVASSSSSISSLSLPAIFSFGDSILDAGNNRFSNNCIVQADFPPYGSTFFHHPTGRFTNGRTVSDFISQFIGIEIQKPFLEAEIAVSNGTWKEYPANGINFASAGSGVLQETNKIWGVTPIQIQLQQFQKLVEQNLINQSLVQNSILLFESGSNDIFNYFLPFDTPRLDPEAYVQAMLTEVSNLIEQLHKHGAPALAVISLGPVGCVPGRALLPGVPVDQCCGDMNKMVENYNQGLESLVKDIPVKYPGMVAAYGAVYDIVQQFRAIPTLYGFGDVSSACCGDGTLRGQLQCGKKGYKICQKPSEYLFWDYFHPTEHTYRLISEALWSGNKSQIRPFNLKALANITQLANTHV